jgi:hypothetical protein
VEVNQFLTWLLIAGRAIINTFFLTAFSYCAGSTIADQISTLAVAAITIDFFRLKVKPKLIGIHGGSFHPGFVIIVSGSDKCRAFCAAEPTESNGF